MRKTLFIFLIFFTLSSCSLMQYQDLKYLGADNISNISRVEKENRTYTISVDFKIENPNVFNVKIKPSDINVFLNNSKIGVIRLDEKVKLSKKSEGVYTTKLNLKLEKINLLNLVTSALFGKPTIHFLGKVKAGTGIFSKEFDIDESRELDINQLKRLLEKFY